jgi:WxL Interacting Protein, peptidoglycan binding domain
MGRWYRRRARTPRRWAPQGLLVAAALLATLAAAPPGGLGIGGAFGISPAPDSQGRTSSYFQLTIAPGQSATATAVVSNLADKPATLVISRAAGVTASNSGSAYEPISRGCSGPSCWVAGLPQRVTLPAHSREKLDFTVTVPAGTALGQYLSGISIEPAVKPRAVKVGSNGKTGAQAAIVEEVTVGVAVTVGDLSAMTTRFTIPGVLGTLEYQTPRLNIKLDNTGQTFAKGTGTASCTPSGKRHTYAVSVDTVLPGGQALVAVNAPALPTGTNVPCTIQIHYGKNQAVRWAGTVAIPGLPSARHIVHTGYGVYSQVPQGGIPGWAIALIAIGALLLAGIGVVLYRQQRLARRERQ